MDRAAAPGLAEPAPTTDVERAAAEGGVDRLFRAVDRVPGPPWLLYAVLGIGAAVAAQLALWASGQYPAGVIEPEVVQPPLLAALLIGLTHLLMRVGASTFDDFRPALGDLPTAERYRHQLTSIPDRVALVSMAVAVAVMMAGFMLFVKPYIEPRPPIVDMLTAPLWIIAAAAAGIFIAHDLRQLRAVSALSRTARDVDIFKPNAINAFSRLTSVSAVTILLLVSAAVLSEREIPTAYLIQISALAALGVATFVLPLRAMHSRLEGEKSRLQMAAEERLKSVLSRIHEAVDRDDLSRADELQKTLSSVLAEREVLARLHTWPWSTTTFRGVASAFLLPIVIFVITRSLERLL